MMIYNIQYTAFLHLKRNILNKWYIIIFEFKYTLKNPLQLHSTTRISYKVISETTINCKTL